MSKSREYPIHEIEEKWQKWWKEIGLHRTKENPENKYYVLEMFPYPSGDLHMGHLKNYVIGDVVARVKLMEGYDILHPMGWDAFGLPAENAAIKHGIDPKEWTYKNINTYKETLQSIGITYDWDREIATCSPDYYKWTQWIFLFLYKRGLAYRKNEYVNWCPNCKTVLANEQVIEGKCERCGTPVVKKKLEQWFFKITDYADKLLEDLKLLEGKWPPKIIKQQENWIGKSEGTEIVFLYQDGKTKLPVFTTRADTVFGVTFITIAPEHEILEKILKDSPNREKVEKYIQEALQKTEIERTAEEKEKTGVFTGTFAIHPLTGEKVEIWVADYVLVNYGTGIVMGVPAHDERDYKFAKKYGIPIKTVVKPVNGEIEDGELFTDYGIMVNSGEFSGLPSKEGIKAIQKKLKELGLGGEAVSYRLKDWLISRQRYWGAPIPVVHCPKCGVVPVPEEDLPVLLPENIKSFKPEGRSPLEDVEEFMNTTCPKCGGPARRDPDTMDTFVDSSWYYLRYVDPHNDHEPFSKKEADKWMPVDQYIGGAEHATKHLIYARFVNKVFYDAGMVPSPEPFSALFTQGLVHKKFYWCPKCLEVVDESDIEFKEIEGEKIPFHKKCGERLEERVEMMSKSRGNVVRVGPFVREHGADVARITILFAGPAEKDMEWTDAGVEGAKRFINRVWRLYQEFLPKIHKSGKVDPDKLTDEEKKLYVTLQRTIYEVRKDSAEFHFNTAIARIMELVNALYTFQNSDSPVFSESLQKLVLLLAPFAPHLAEELWHQLGNEDSVFRNKFPEYNEEFLTHDTIEIPVQINGKVRSRITVPADASEEDVIKTALQDDKVKKFVEGKEIVKKIYVPKKLLSLVVRNGR